MRRALSTVRAGLALALLAGFVPVAESGPGKYERRRAKRGEQTDTSPKLSAFAFIDDSMEPRRELVLFVDVGSARNPLVDELLPIRVGMSYRGEGPTLDLEPGHFRLSWEGLEEPLTPLGAEDMLEHPRGPQALRQEARVHSARVSPSPFGPRDGARVGTSFYVDPARSTFLNDDASLSPGGWFTDRLFFRLEPNAVERWQELFELSYVHGEPPEPLVSVLFRLQRDTDVHRDAFRRARKARKKADKALKKADERARKEARRAEREADSDGAGDETGTQERSTGGGAPRD